MNKKELTVILNHYKNIYYTHTVVKIDKADSLREFKFLLESLGLKKERYIVENEVIAENFNLKSSVKECYSMIFKSFVKYGVYTNYDLDEIDTYYQELTWEFTEEENKCHKARVKYILENS